MDLERFGEIVSASVVSGTQVTPEQVASTLSNDELLQAVRERSLNVGPLATTEALTNPATNEVESTAPTPESVEVELTPEEQERVATRQTVLAEKFSTKERVLTPEDFGAVVVGEGEARKVVVMLTTGNGLYLGSYNTIMSDTKANEAKYMIEVDGQMVDTRKAMTWDVYQKFIAQAKANNPTAPLPDSKPLSDDNGQPHTATWLTGEPADEFNANCGGVYGGRPRRSWGGRRGGWRDLRIRPAAVV